MIPPVRCEAAHPDDRTRCEGPPAVTILDLLGTEVTGCVHHAARMYASLESPRVYPLPGHDGAAFTVYQRAQTIRPFCWLEEGAQ